MFDPDPSTIHALKIDTLIPNDGYLSMYMTVNNKYYSNPGLPL